MEESFVNISHNERVTLERAESSLWNARNRPSTDTRQSRDTAEYRRVGVQQRLRCSLFCEITITRWMDSSVSGTKVDVGVFLETYRSLVTGFRDIGRIFVGFVMIS